MRIKVGSYTGDGVSPDNDPTRDLRGFKNGCLIASVVWLLVAIALFLWLTSSGRVSAQAPPLISIDTSALEARLADHERRIALLEQRPTATPPPATQTATQPPSVTTQRGLLIRQYNEVNAGALEWGKREHGVRGVTFISNYPHRRTSDLSQDELDTFRRSLDTIRAAGMFTTVRFSYWFHWDGSDQLRLDAQPAQAFRHIDQLAPIINANRDIILAVEAGFAGKWGEWHYHGVPQQFHTYGERNLSHSQTHPRALLLKKLVASFQTPIGLRYPRDIRWAFGFLTEPERAKIVHHNDALLGNANESGTWDPGTTAGETDQQWFYRVYVPMPSMFMFGEFLGDTDFNDAQLRDAFGTLARRKYLAHSYDSGMPIREALGRLGLWDDLERGLENGW